MNALNGYSDGYSARVPVSPLAAAAVSLCITFCITFVSFSFSRLIAVYTAFVVRRYGGRIRGRVAHDPPAHI